MRLSDRWNAIKQWLEQRERERALATFTCSDCERNSQCGRAPTNDCLVKHAQINRGEHWRYRTMSVRGRAPYF